MLSFFKELRKMYSILSISKNKMFELLTNIQKFIMAKERDPVHFYSSPRSYSLNCQTASPQHTTLAFLGVLPLTHLLWPGSHFMFHNYCRFSEEESLRALTRFQHFNPTNINSCFFPLLLQIYILPRAMYLNDVSSGMISWHLRLRSC